MKTVKHGCLILLVLLLLPMFGCHRLTEVEWAQYLADHTRTYEVLSASQYIKPVTNQFGNVIRTETCYTFTYTDENGGLYVEDDFQHLEYGLTKLCLGDTNQYKTVEDGLDTYRYLYLTKDTFQSMNMGG